jgi:hypothetical protein
VRTCKAVTQHYLRYAETINDRYRYLKSALPTIGERGVGEIERKRVSARVQTDSSVDGSIQYQSARLTRYGTTPTDMKG